MQITPYLTFDGQCEAAFTFYAGCLGTPLQALMRFSEAPDSEQMPPHNPQHIMHARLALGDQALMGSDTCAGQPYEGVRGCSVSLNVDSITEAERLFSALGEGGSVQMPLQQTFWAVRFGMLVDRFGVPWMVNCEQDA